MLCSISVVDGIVFINVAFGVKHRRICFIRWHVAWWWLIEIDKSYV